jgi:D,D-heptose 1,7-bisphosphate phosphatase
MTKFPRQCAVLVGGLGTRLGALTAATPKPLLECGGRPFLAWILRELTRFGIEEIILLAGYRPELVVEFSHEVNAWLPKSLDITVSVEPHPAGTGGALWHARSLLDEHFLLINGDSWLDVNLARFLANASDPTPRIGHVLLHRTEDASRYGIVDVADGLISAFRERPQTAATGVINAGIYAFTHAIFDFLSPQCSLERDVLPRLAAAGLLSGEILQGYFIDIGVPADYIRAQSEIPLRFKRPAVFFDRDDVLNENLGWVGTRDRFRWQKGAKGAVRLVNESGCHAFIVTNQAGIARGLYSESDLMDLHAWVMEELHSEGATIDDWRFCPHHPNAPIERYRTACACRKPEPGMILALINAWQVEVPSSFLVGDSQSDIAAAERAGMAGHLYDAHEPLDQLVSRLLSQASGDRRSTE